LLVLLIGGGGYNYWRNLEQEKREARPRPFESYATPDLESLRGAYAQEVSTAQSRFDAQQRRRVRASGNGLIGEQIEEFERVKRSTSKLRDLQAEVAESEARLREIDYELGFRRAQLSGLKLHLKRLVTL
jgi:hypothetical protein